MSGQPVTLDATFEVSGTPENATSVQLDVTYGSSVFQGTEIYGPVTWQGASSPVAGQVWQTGTGAYSAVWAIPDGTQAGVYVATWTITYSGSTYTETENFYVSGGVLPPVPAGDTGFWTGGIIYPGAGLDIEFGTVDGNGIAWLWQKLTGWDSPPVQGAGVIPRSGDHGAWASPQYYAARTMTLTVTASAPTQALRDTARSLLQQAVPISDLATLRYDEPIPKQASVRRSGQITEAYPTLCDVTFTVGLVAPDPRKYAATGKSIGISPMPSGVGGDMVEPFTVPFSLAAGPPPGSGVAVNNGDFTSPPVAVITGPVTGPTLMNATTGQTVSWSTLTLGAGHLLVVDFLNREAWVDPVTVSTTPGMPGTGGTYWPADINSGWWQLQPGDNTVQIGGSAGTGCTASLFYADTWV